MWNRGGLIIKEQEVFRGKLLHFFMQRVRLPNNYEVDLELIKHPGAALIVPFLSPQQIILLRQFRPVVNQYLYEVPAGTLSAQEDHLSCARRELLEETGYSAQAMKKIGVIYPVPGYSTEKIVLFKASRLKKTVASSEKDEIIQTHIMKKKDVSKLFSLGHITDAKTICALSFCGWLK